MSEKWTQNKFGFISNEKEFFHVREIKGLAKKDDDSIEVWLFARCLTLKWSSPIDRDPMFNWFIKVLEDHEQRNIEHSQLHYQMQATSIEIQNKMAGALIK